MPIRHVTRLYFLGKFNDGKQRVASNNLIDDFGQFKSSLFGRSRSEFEGIVNFIIHLLGWNFL